MTIRIIVVVGINPHGMLLNTVTVRNYNVTVNDDINQHLKNVYVIMKIRGMFCARMLGLKAIEEHIQSKIGYLKGTYASIRHNCHHKKKEMETKVM